MILVYFNTLIVRSMSLVAARKVRVVQASRLTARLEWDLTIVI